MANGARASPAIISVMAFRQPTMGPSVQAENPNTYERPVTPPLVSRSISTRAAVGMAPLALAGGRLNGTSTGRARRLRIVRVSVIDVLRRGPSVERISRTVVVRVPTE